jgi:hypothetical protein
MRICLFLVKTVLPQGYQVAGRDQTRYNDAMPSPQDSAVTPKRPSIFSHMNWLDWLLTASFTALMGFIADLFLPTYGWFLGGLAGLALIYLAKTRRDAAYADAEKEKTLPPEEEK